MSEHKILVVTVNASLKWDSNINVVTSKATKRLWCLKKLKRTGVARKDLAYFYQAVVRPILEYACPAWHTSLTKEQSKKLEDIQRRAVQIIAGNIHYEEACFMLDFPSLSARGLSMCETLFKQIHAACEFHVLHYLLSAKRDTELSCRTRSINKYPTVYADKPL